MSESTLEYVKRLADQLVAEEKLSLVERLARSLKQDQAKRAGRRQRLSRCAASGAGDFLKTSM